MIDFATIKSEITAFMPDLTGLPAAQIRWRDQAEGSAWVADPSVWMRLQAVTRRGIEEEFRQDNGPGQQAVTMHGQRQFTWNIRAESFEQDISSVKFAGNVLDTMCTRLMRSTSIFARTSFAIVHRTATQFFSYKDQGRQVSCYVLDILCATKETDIDTSERAGDWIGSARVYGDIDGVREVDEIITTGDT